MTVIVPRAVERAPRNALWELFSAEAERVAEGARNFRWQAADHLPILNELYRHYRNAGLRMSYTIEDFRRDVALEVLPELPPEERLRGLPPEERLRGLPPEERLRGLRPEERLRGLPPEERLQGLSKEELVRLRALLDRELPDTD
ncbi:hypothetical protein [Thiohalocapsa sp.]|uniref:hypothetical protein n=1 Tax=Thiohalocapsa sp. TaxID=2497641 RepID=UPI0025E49CC2|nr:hypothetical protein [Thiohalocapsa sp.]